MPLKGGHIYFIITDHLSGSVVRSEADCTGAADRQNIWDEIGDKAMPAMRKMLKEMAGVFLEVLLESN